MPTIDVTLPADAYQVLIEPGSLARLGEIVRDVAPHAKAVLAVDRNVKETHAPIALRSLRERGYDVIVHELVAEETCKSLETVRGMYDVMLAHRCERGTPVIALGGGVVGDVAGFAAATYLRGVPFVQAPTTLLAMVDASIGGKTGVNVPRPADASGHRELGKNLVGAFWQPRAVIADPDVLRTLAPREIRCGLAESVKHGVLGDAELLSYIDAHAEAIARIDPPVMAELVLRSARIKVGIVEADEREASRRMLLNLGHTFAHVLEPIAALDLRHGEAVAIGLCAAAFGAVATGRLGIGEAHALTDLLAKLGLPTRMPLPQDVSRLVEAMGFDKKVAGGRTRLILPTALGCAEIAEDVPHAAIVSAWRAVGARES